MLCTAHLLLATAVCSRGNVPRGDGVEACVDLCLDTSCGFLRQQTRGHKLVRLNQKVRVACYFLTEIHGSGSNAARPVAMQHRPRQEQLLLLLLLLLLLSGCCVPTLID